EIQNLVIGNPEQIDHSTAFNKIMHETSEEREADFNQTIPMDCHTAMRFLNCGMPDGAEAHTDWSPEYTAIVTAIHNNEGRSIDADELDDLIVYLQQLRAAVAKLEAEE